MAEKDLRDLAHCLYMFDLLVREIGQSPAIADKEAAVDALLGTMSKVLRREGYPVTTTKLKTLLAYAG